MFPRYNRLSRLVGHPVHYEFSYFDIVSGLDTVYENVDNCESPDFCNKLLMINFSSFGHFSNNEMCIIYRWILIGYNI